MKSLKLYLLPLLILAAVSLAGCARPPAPVERPAVRSQQELLARLQNRAALWDNYQATLQIRADSPRGKFRIRSLVLAKLPHEFRLEAFNLFGQTIGVLVLSPEASRLWVPSEGVIYTAEQPELLVEYFLGIPIPLETFGYSVIASAPPDQLQGMRAARDAAGWTATSSDPSGTWTGTWRFRADPLLLESVKIEGKQHQFAIQYEPAASLDLQRIPKRISFQSSQWQMEVTVSNVTRATTFQAAAFAIPVPSGTREVALYRR